MTIGCSTQANSAQTDTYFEPGTTEKSFRVSQGTDSRTSPNVATTSALSTSSNGCISNYSVSNNGPSNTCASNDATLFAQLLAMPDETSHANQLSNIQLLNTQVPSIQLPITQSQNLSRSISSVANGVAGISQIQSSSSLVTHIATNVSGTLNSLSLTGDRSAHSFSLIIPGQANLNVSTQVNHNGIRSLQLSSEEEKLNHWLEENHKELSLALNDALNESVQLSIGAPA